MVTLLILGASGDLTSRLLLPAIGQLLKREPDRQLTLHGAGSDAWSTKHWRETVQTAFATVDAGGEAARVAGTVYTKADVTDRDALAGLVDGVKGPLV
ncbi:MAG: glucose-6-phosphate dehydrogenase, partial [Microbacterium sp.]